MPPANNRLLAAARYINKHRSAYLFISPFFIGFAVFGLYPMLYSIYLSFTQYKFRAPSLWVGLGNYQDVSNDPTFWISLKNTLFLWLGTLPLELLLAFCCLADQCLHRPTLERGTFRYLLPAPGHQPGGGGAGLPAYLDNQYGVANYFLRLAGAPLFPGASQKAGCGFRPSC